MRIHTGLTVAGSFALIIAGSSLLVATPAALGAAVNEDKLSVVLTVPPGGTTDQSIHIVTAGPVPSDGVLVSDDGRHRIPVQPTVCDDAVGPFFAGEGDDDWCLQLGSLRGAETATGTLSGDQSALALTVAVRHPYVWLPLVVSVLTVLLAMAVGRGVKHNQAGVVAAQIGSLLRTNRRSNSPIDGLDRWTDNAQVRMELDDVLASLRVIVAQGRDLITADRSELESLKSDVAIERTHPLMAKAARELKRGQSFTAGEVRSHDGKPTTSTAATLTALLRRLDTAYDQYRTVLDGMNGLPTAPRELRDKVEELGALLAIADEEISMSRVEEASVQARAELSRSDPAGALQDLGAASHSRTVSETVDAEAEDPAATADDVASRREWQKTLATSSMLLLVYIVVAVWAAKAAVYDTNTDFGALNDYVVLATTVFAAAATTQTVALVLLWDKGR